MAEKHPQTETVNIGVVTDALRPLFQVPTGTGGITITEAWAAFGEAGTAGLYLINAGALGTTTGTDGTLATYGGTAYTALTPIEMTVASSPYIGEGSFVALKEDSTGSTDGTTVISFSYLYGK